MSEIEQPNEIGLASEFDEAPLRRVSNHPRVQLKNGSREHPFILDVTEDAWQATGDVGQDADGNPYDIRTRLSCRLKFAGILMHVHAFEVHDVRDGSEAGWSSYITQAVNPNFQKDIESIWTIAGWPANAGPLRMAIQGRGYLVTMFPYA